MIALAYLYFARNVWTGGRLVAQVNFGLIAIGLDCWVIGEML